MAFTQVRVVGPDGDIVWFKLKRNEKMIRLKRAYCNHFDLDVDAMVFSFRSRDVEDEDTAQSLKILYGMKIYVTEL